MTVRNDWVGHLRHYPLKELRRRQNLTTQQIKNAYEANNERALTDFRNMADSLTKAVFLNEFA